MMVGALLGIAGLIYLVLGGLHAVYTLARHPRSAPHRARRSGGHHGHAGLEDPAERGESTTMWQGWVGFNLSHSLGRI